MMADQKQKKPKQKNRMGWLLTLAACILILLGAAVVTFVIFNTEPTANRSGATKKTAMLVDVIPVEKADFHPELVVMGTVVPEQDISLSSRVSGEVIRRSENFTPGGRVEKGEVLLQLDPDDYRNTLEQRKSELRQAVADLNIEMGRQDVAEKDYQLLDESLTPENESLVLRRPQLNAARARVESARAAVAQAELDLSRTSITAPFDALIISREVNVGSQVAPGSPLGRLVGMRAYWIEATVPLSHLIWIAFPEDNDSGGSSVRVRNRSSWPDGLFRTGKVDRLVGTLEGATRLARVLVEVQDPLAILPESGDKPKLMIGEFLECRIEGREIADVVRLSRDYLRKDDTVWVNHDGKLEIRDVDIVMQDARYAYIRDGLEAGEKVVITNLTTVTEGAGLRTEANEEEGMADE